MSKKIILILIIVAAAIAGYFGFVRKTCREMPAPGPLDRDHSKVIVCSTWFRFYFFDSVQPQGSQITQPCIQVITPARNPQTGEIRDFPTPCDVPEGWEKI